MKGRSLRPGMAMGWKGTMRGGDVTLGRAVR
jgi:hypothetical protein